MPNPPARLFWCPTALSLPACLSVYHQLLHKTRGDLEQDRCVCIDICSHLSILGWAVTRILNTKAHMSPLLRCQTSILPSSYYYYYSNGAFALSEFPLKKPTTAYKPVSDFKCGLFYQHIVSDYILYFLTRNFPQIILKIQTLILIYACLNFIIHK